MWSFILFLLLIAAIELLAYRFSVQLRTNALFKKAYGITTLFVLVSYTLSLIHLTRLYHFPSWFIASVAVTMGGLLVIKLFYILYSLLLLIPHQYYLWNKRHKNQAIDTSRRRFLETALWSLTLYPIYRIIKGIVYDKYQFNIRYVDLFYADLPTSFDGFTITQFTDFHSGSLEVNEGYLNGFRFIQDLKSDIIVFTGDAVNNTQDEFVPWIKHWRKLNARYGKYAILGNHDYADYITWDSPEAKEQNLAMLKKHIRSAGFHLLLNDSVELTHNGESIDLMGVENWGKPPFPTYGDLDKTLSLSKNDFKILLSHDPSHYEIEVSQHKTPIHLTLSGHTHGMQLGFRFPWLDKLWSPVSLKYKYWKGLYGPREKHLYVNPGFGVIGYKGRINMPPEITQFRLRKG